MFLVNWTLVLAHFRSRGDMTWPGKGHRKKLSSSWHLDPWPGLDLCHEPRPWSENFNQFCHDAWFKVSEETKNVDIYWRPSLKDPLMSPVMPSWRIVMVWEASQAFFSVFLFPHLWGVMSWWRIFIAHAVVVHSMHLSRRLKYDKHLQVTFSKYCCTTKLQPISRRYFLQV